MNHDVYVYGMISSSTVFRLDERFSYPAANTYAEIAAIHPSVGGEAANSAVVLSRFGVPTLLDGVWLHSREAKQVRELLAPFGIDLSRLTVMSGDAGAREIVISDRTSRTVFGNYAAFNAGSARWNTPVEEDIRACRLAVIDPYFRDQTKLAAELCMRHHKPYVTHDASCEDFFGQNAAANVVSHELLGWTFKGQEPDRVFDRFLETCAGLVVFTFGAEELWYGRKGGGRKTFTPCKITPVDTTGAGDSFRGALAYGLLRGWDDEKTIRFASATAACVCLTIPHALGCPDLDGVRRFMEEHD